MFAECMRSCCFGKAYYSSDFNLEGERSDGALLAGALPDRFPQSNIPQHLGSAAPKWPGGFDAFVAATPGIVSQAFNSIKKCADCGKPCAITMDKCNACGADLTAVAVTKSPNLFIGFIFGVDKAGFPLKISMRAETPSMMVFDDPLAITRAHVLAVPTDVYCPDIRSLFLNPSKAIRMLETMDDAAWKALVAGPLSDPQWRTKALSREACALTVDELRPKAVRAFNLPPSQYQLHLQYMMPPLLPSHVGVLRKGAHFVKFRSFPFNYIVEALRAFEAAGKTLPNAEGMKAQELVDAVAELGVQYEPAWEADMQHIKTCNQFMSNFSEEDFQYYIKDEQVFDKVTGKPAESENALSAKNVENQDKLALQGYGRPYTVEGKPGGVYYSHARAEAPMSAFG